MDDSMSEGDRRSMWSMIKEGYEGLVMTVIRPLRATYSPADLGPKRAMLRDVVMQRTDMKLKNPGGYTLECSWWRPKTEKTQKTPCIVILHGNSSCRLGGLEIVSYAIPAGFSAFALDFSGSGLSEGKYVSLGYHEREDIATVVKYLRESGEVSNIILWGRSMGAVAALLYAETDPEINALVLDSPFSSLPQLATELVADGKLGVPKIAVNLVMRLIRRDIKKRAKFDMFKLKPIAKVSKCTIPAFFVAGLNDELVGPHHVRALSKAHNGPNQLYQFQGGHNSPRPANFFIQALQFVRVMIGMLPLQLDSPMASPEKPQRTPVVLHNPLEPGMSIEMVHKMSIKELKACIDRAGFSDVTCIEKAELVELVLKLYARWARLNLQEAIAASGSAKASPPPSAHASSPSEVELPRSQSSRELDTPSSVDKGRRHSEGSLETVEEFPDVQRAFFPAMTSSCSSIMSDAELTQALGRGHRTSGEDYDEEEDEEEEEEHSVSEYDEQREESEVEEHV
ncbi:TPA: hypothetical protein N0F65_001768 [Lagenidium giganteum]|uniref:Serine aminopeptidase S33 domain-containing protein n=1 Tax=Lagenidium giganteum TaxID=4803 RepID=A0AAV2Z5P9_9STRA|nr:TPA: hypothetical protein N0F65_001768 [Lagenidium giganteum]